MSNHPDTRTAAQRRRDFLQQYSWIKWACSLGIALVVLYFALKFKKTNLVIMGGLVAIFAGFGLPHLLWNVLQEGAARDDEADKETRRQARLQEEAEAQKLRAALEAEEQQRIQAAQRKADEVRIRQQAERQAHMEKFRSLGLAEGSLAPWFPTLTYSAGGTPEQRVRSLATALLDEAGSHFSLWKQYVENAAAGTGLPRMVSLGFSSELPGLMGADAEYFRRDLTRALEDVLVEKMSPAGAVGGDAKIRYDVQTSLRIDVWLCARLDSEIFLHGKKAILPPDGPVRWLVRPDQWQDDARKPFLSYTLNQDKLCESSARKFLLLGNEGSLTVAAQDTPCDSALIDMRHAYINRTLPIAAAARDAELTATLGISCIQQQTAFVPVETMTRNFKGAIKLVGWWRRGKWTPCPRNVTSQLSISAPNIFIKEIASAFGDEVEEENRLLTDMFRMQDETFGHAIAEKGNFVIRRGRISDASSVFKYFIQPTQGSVKTTWYRRPLGDTADQHGEAEAYQEFVPAQTPRSPLEREGWFRLPFSECYLKTGGSELQLCLHLDVGSPAVEEDERGLVDYNETTLRAALFRYAANAGSSYREIHRAAAQGFLATVETPVGIRYLKLLEPPHVALFRTEKLVSSLQKAGVVPASVSVTRIDTQGRVDDSGVLRVFSTPEMPTLDAAVRDPKLDTDARLRLCLGLVRFCHQCSGIPEGGGIFCTDFTLADTMLATSLPQWLASPDQPGDSGGIFVADYGSYLFKDSFTRGSRINKDQYAAPEDFNSSLEFSAESYQVFLLGLLFLEILGGQPGSIPAPVTALSGPVDPAEWATQIRQCVEQVLGERYADQVKDSVCRMLSADPAQRPTLAEIED